MASLGSDVARWKTSVVGKLAVRFADPPALLVLNYHLRGANGSQVFDVGQNSAGAFSSGVCLTGPGCGENAVRSQRRGRCPSYCL